MEWGLTWSWEVPAYNRERVSEEFRQLADLADSAFRANLRNISADPGAVRAHDELLARACVFGYLYDRHFLHSPELLLNELRWLRATMRPEPPGNCLHPLRFMQLRDELLETLVSRFQNELDYRDSLGAAEKPVAEPGGGSGVANLARRTGERPALGETVRQSSVARRDSE
jgi:hypothetical protein